jgi:O-antigen ligase
LNGLLFIIVITNGFFLLYYHIPQWYDISIQSLFIPPPPNLLQAQSGITRFDLLKEGLKVFIEHPLFGIGAGNFQYHMLTKAARSPDAIVDMHLYWFQLLVEKGILYFILLSASIIMLLKSIYIRYTITSGKMKEFGLSILLSLFVLCFGGMSVSSLAYYLPMYAIIGIAISYLIIPRNNAYSTSG